MPPNTLGEEAALELADVLARPFIVMRNDHQDALRAGLAVSEFAPNSKSADEIRGLWRWVETRLEAAPRPDRPGISSANGRHRLTLAAPGPVRGDARRIRRPPSPEER